MPLKVSGLNSTDVVTQSKRDFENGDRPPIVKVEKHCDTGKD